MKLKPGDMVRYQPEHYGDKFENGLVKRVHPDGNKAWVVYNCNNEWHRIDDYTAALTSYEDLKLGWG